MARAIYFDCFSGISGNMTLGALLHAGLPLGDLLGELKKLDLPEWDIIAKHEMRGYLAGMHVHVQVPKQDQHRNLNDIRTIIERSALSETVKEQSLRVFTLLAESEGLVHGMKADEVHFHEVGAMDAIVDIVGVVIGLELMGIKRIFSGPLPMGTGWVHAAHGLLPVPAPAVLYLLADAGATVVANDTPAELVTPTGAALLAGLATFERPRLFHLSKIGYGLGSRELEHPNALRIWIGEVHDTAHEHSHEKHEHQHEHHHEHHHDKDHRHEKNGHHHEHKHHHDKDHEHDHEQVHTHSH
jgi:pyridinium-3,5-bisthiocarboxylic acid mononucleotide nickel chelatase